MISVLNIKYMTDQVSKRKVYSWIKFFGFKLSHASDGNTSRRRSVSAGGVKL